MPESIESKTHRILESVTDAFFAVDHDWRLTYLNHQASRLLGRSPSELIGKIIWDVFPELPGSEFEAAYRRVLANGTTGSVTAFYPPHGRWYDARIYNCQEGLAIYFCDVTERIRTHEKLRDSEERFRAILQQTAFGVCETDFSGRILVANDRYGEIVGRPRERLLGSTLESMTHPDDRSRDARLLQKLTNAGGFVDVDTRYVRPDHSIVWVHNSITLLQAGGDRPPSLLFLVLDLTDRQRASEASHLSDERLRLMIESVREYAIFSTDLQLRVTSWNRGAERLLGYHEDEIMGRDSAVIFTEEDRAAGAHEAECRVALADGRAADERWHLRKDRTRFWGNGVMMAIRDAAGQTIGFVKILRDQTEARAAHDAVKLSQERLSAALAEAERARVEAEAAAFAKDQFLATLSHELRTPLNPVLLLAGEASADPSLSPEVRECFRTISKNVEFEARLIDDLLDLTRVTQGKIALVKKVLRAHDILRDTIKNLRPGMTAKDISLQVRLDATHDLVFADAVRLQQVFWNLLSNATKFTPEQGTVTLVTANAPDPAWLYVSVTDTGIGMTADETKRAFDAFSQGEHAHGGGSHRFGGLGLGLAIAQQMAKLHGGFIRAASRGRGLGSTFTVELPLTREPVGGAPASFPIGVAATTRPGAQRILLVEDHAPTRGALKSILERRGHKVEAAGSAADAIALVRTHPFSLLVSDIGLPDMDGCELFGHLRTLQPDLKGIALSGYGMENDLNRSAAAGYAMHLVKPATADKLDAAISRLFPPPASNPA